MSLSVGSDSEVLLYNKDHKLISAIGLLGGSKTHPRLTPNGAVQEDGVLAEFNVNPAGVEDVFIQNTLAILGDLNDLVTPLNLGIQVAATGEFDEDQLKDPAARMAGCMPDYDAWSLQENVAPVLDAVNLRSCGGHLHIAFDKANEDRYNRVKFVRAMDLVAAVPSVLMDDDTKRRSLYGKAGAHRMKFVKNSDPYDGVEYRTLSNFWLRSKELMGWAFRTVATVDEHFDHWVEVAEREETTIINAVNNSDKDAAESLVNKYDLEVIYA